MENPIVTTRDCEQFVSNKLKWGHGLAWRSNFRHGPRNHGFVGNDDFDWFHGLIHRRERSFAHKLHKISRNFVDWGPRTSQLKFSWCTVRRWCSRWLKCFAHFRCFSAAEMLGQFRMVWQFRQLRFSASLSPRRLGWRSAAGLKFRV